MSAAHRLIVLELESRLTPATFGVPWPDGGHLHLSFAPDGTAVLDAPSTLAAKFGPGTAWKYDILRAIQTWAVNGNVNIGVVSDNGAPLLTSGPAQGDPRFGDIRVAARNLGDDALAVTAPYGPIDVWAGNLVVNSGVNFGPGGYDLYTAMLQETAHALGVGDSTDPASPLYEYYVGTRLGLTAGDVANLQALYGARRPDVYEGEYGNSSLAQATPFPGPLEADINNPGDVDTFRFFAPISLVPLQVRLQAAGLSLLAPRVTVFDGFGNVLAQSASVDPLNNSLTVNLPLRLFGGTTYIQVSSARTDVFGVGAYRLDVSDGVHELLGGALGLVGGLVQSLIALPDPEMLPHSNDARWTATLVSASATAPNSATYSTRGVLADPSDLDFYKMKAPANGSAALVAQVWPTRGDTVRPDVTMFDASGQPVPIEILIKDDGTASVEALAPAGGLDYYIRVSSSTGGTGEYQLSANFVNPAVPLPFSVWGTVTSSTQSPWADLNVPQSELFHFVLSENAPAGVTVTATFVNEAGQVAYQIAAGAGGARSGDVILAPGHYRVNFSAQDENGGLSASTFFRLAGWGITDPIGAPSSDPSNPSPPPPPPDWTSGSGTYTGGTGTPGQPSG